MNRMIRNVAMAATATLAAMTATGANALSVQCPAYETKTPYVSPENPGEWVVEVKQRRFPFNINVKDIPPMGECAGYYRVEALPVWDVREHEPETRP